MSRIFLLGDSRTGTTSIHQFLVERGIPSLHYYVREAGLAEPLHRHRRANWPRLHDFIENSDARAFCDYPTRVFYRELADTYPDASFLLSTRRDTATWRASMLRKLGGTITDIDMLSAYYTAWNEEIRSLFAERGGRFLEFRIEDEAASGAGRLAEFLGLDPGDGLPHLHASAT